MNHAELVRVWPLYPGDYEEPPSRPQEPRTVNGRRKDRTSAKSLSERILDAVESHPRTRTELCRALRVAPSQIAYAVKVLAKAGRLHVEVLQPRQGTRGRMQHLYRKTGP